MDDAVNALAVDGSGNLYAGGYFHLICGDLNCGVPTPVNHVAKWNGSSWSALLNGFNDNVYALAVDGSNVYAGGAFTLGCGNSICNSGNYSLTHLAQWNGSNWLTVGDGVDGNVRALAVAPSNYLYVGGEFAGICANSACSSQYYGNRISLRSGGCCWTVVGNGLNATVKALAIDASGNLFAGGVFTEICGILTCNSSNITTNYVAKWNGINWSPLGSGFNSDVNALALDAGGGLYAAGAFWLTGGSSVNSIARWNGSVWSPLGSGLNDTASALAVGRRYLYVGGFFTTAGGTSAPYIAQYLLHLLNLPLILK